MLPDDHHRGTTTGYRHGCRQACCRKAMADAMANRRKRLYLARTDTLAVPNIGTRRRIQALMAIGWSQSRISREAGYDRSHVSLILMRGGALQQRTVDRIAEVYERLSMTLPPMTTGPEKVAATRARNLAAERGWAPPLAWNDIDDPGEEPVMGRDIWDESSIDDAVIDRVLAGGKRPRKLTRAEAGEIVARSLGRGMSGNQIEDLYGLKPERYVRGGERVA